MKYMTAKEAAEKWEIKERRVRALANEGRILGAVIDNGIWKIPVFAEKPEDKRCNNKIRPIKIDLNDEECGDGFYGEFGGCYLPQGFKNVIEPVLLSYNKLFNSASFMEKLNQFRKRVQFRTTPLYYAEKFSKYLGFVGLYIKREDLNFGGSLYINQTIPMAFLAKELGKKHIYGECGDANYGIALAYAAKYLDLDLELYVGYKDYLKQKIAFDQIKILGGKYTIVTEGNQNLYDATNACFRKFLLNNEDSFYAFHDAVGPHPFPYMAEHSQVVISEEIAIQFKELSLKEPNYVVAPLNIASNALAIFDPYLKKNVKLIAVENETSVVKNGKISKIHGSFTKTVVDEHTGKTNYNVDCPGMNYPIISPKLCDLIKQGRVQVQSVTDEEAIRACLLFGRLEGFLPSFEDGYTLAYIIKLSQKIKSGRILMCMTGNGTKDIEYFSSKDV